MPELDGKVAIVTGAGRLRGIGRAAAVAFAELGADVLQRVQHRWQELNATVSSVTASDMIEGSVAEKGLKGWDHPDLILPATGFDDLARKRKASYSVADIEHMLQRLRDVSVRIDDLEGLDHLTTGVMRRTLTPHYDKTALLLDVLSGRVPTYRTVDQPRLRDLYAEIRAERLAS